MQSKQPSRQPSQRTTPTNKKNTVKKQLRFADDEVLKEDSPFIFIDTNGTENHE